MSSKGARGFQTVKGVNHEFGVVLVSNAPFKWFRGFDSCRYTGAQRDGVTRFPNNPEENWGPKMRAGRPMPGGGGEEKQGTTKKQRTQ